MQHFIDIENFTNNVIRSSGLARSAMILIIPLFFSYLFNLLKVCTYFFIYF